MAKKPIQRNNFTELKLHKHLLSQKDRLQNNPELILKEIDDFGLTHTLINLGPFKGTILQHQLSETNPEIVFEFGTYVGYSSILIASQLLKLGDHNDSVLYTFEMDPILFEISKDIIQLSGLTDNIIQINGKISQTIEQTVIAHAIEKVDFLFIDHFKYYYLPDLRVVESLGLITKGTTLFADNIISPGAPDYLEYIKAAPITKRAHNSRVKNINGEKFQGKWGTIYDTITVMSKKGQGDLDGVEITKCSAILD